MNKKDDVKKAGFYYLVGTLFNKGIGFITVPIFTRILTLDDYGLVTTYNSWVSIVSMFVSLALYMAVRASFIDLRENVDDFLSVITTFTLVYGCIITAFVTTIMYILPVAVDVGLVILCFIQSLASALIENVSMYFMMKYRYKARTMIMILPNLLSTIIAIILIKVVLNTDRYLGRIIPNVSITAMFGIVAVFYALKHSEMRFNKYYLQYGLRISAPLILHGIALNVLAQSDRTMITSIRSASETGIYGLIYNFSMIATVLPTALDGVWIPFFTEKMRLGAYDEINAISKKYIKLMTSAIVGVILVAPELVKILSTRSYWEGISIIPPIVLANYLIFLYTMYVNVEHYYKKTVFISLNTLAAAISNIVLNLYFIRSFGYVGAAYTTMVSYLFSLILHYMYARRLNKELFPLKQFFMPTVCVAMVVIVFYAFEDIRLVRWVMALVCMIVVFFTEKKWVKSILEKGI